MGFTKLEKDVLNISKLPDSVQGNAKDLKATFDKAGEDIKEAHNKLIDELAEQNAASNIGAMSEEGATTVQAELDKLNDRIHVDFTELEIELDDKLSKESENAVKNKVIAKEVDAIKGDLYTIDRKNSATVGVKELSNGLSTKNIFDDLVVFGFNDCRNAMVDIKGSSVYSESDTYKLLNAFDTSVSSSWESDASIAKPYLEFRFKEPIKINKIKTRIWGGSYFTQAKIVASNNEIVWTPLYTLTAVQSAVEELVLENTDYFSVYRIEWEFSKVSSAYLYHFELTEWEGSHKVYCHNLSLPLSKYELGKKIAVQLSEQIFEESNYIEEEFSENIIPDMSATTFENQYGKWQAAGTADGTKYTPFDRDESTSVGFKSATMYTSIIESVNGASNGNLFAIKPQTIRIYGNNFGNTKIQGKRTDGYWETIGTMASTSTSSQWNTININTNKYYSGIRMMWNCNSTGNYSYLYSFEITKGSIRYGKPFGKTLNTFNYPYLDINELGIKRINEIISAGQLYSLLYNGESWDVFREYVAGTYTGDDVNERLIPLGFKPKAVYVEPNAFTGDDISKGLILENAPISNSKYAYIVDNGFVVKYSSGNCYLNSKQDSWNPYRYIAFK